MPIYSGAPTAPAPTPTRGVGPRPTDPSTYIPPDTFSQPYSLRALGREQSNIGPRINMDPYGTYGRNLFPQPNPNDPATSALSNYLNSQYSSQLAALNSQLSGQGIDAAYQNRLLGLNQGAAQTDYDLTLQRITNAEQRDVNLPRQDIAANRAYLAANQDYINALRGYLPQTSALNLATRNNAYGRSQLDYDTTYRNSLSDAVTRGAVNSQGLRDTQDEIMRQLGLSRGSADIAYGRSQIDVGKEAAGLTRDQAGITRDQALLDTKNKTLDTISKDYGIDRATAEYALKNGLQKLGLDYDTTIQKITNATGETQKQIEALWPMLQQQALALAGQG